MTDSQNKPADRPEFMAILGLLPPYTLEEVKGAYHPKLQAAHPDHGGNIDEFRQIHAAYEEAQRYLAFRNDKRAWIAAQMDRYAALERLEEQLIELGAEVQHQEIDWLQRSYGDFAQLTATVESVRLHDSPHGNGVVQMLLENHELVSSLKRIELVRCELTDEVALTLARLQLIEQLDLRGNALTSRVVELAKQIPSLHELRLDGASLGVWGRMKLSRLLRANQARTRA